MTEEELLIRKKDVYDELKIAVVKLMLEFVDKYSGEGEGCFYPKVDNVLVDVLADCLSQVEYKIQGAPRFTSKQIDHICYQIGDWYLLMKPLLEGTHNLGYMKEKLKTMICGDA